MQFNCWVSEWFAWPRKCKSIKRDFIQIKSKLKEKWWSIKNCKSTIYWLGGYYHMILVYIFSKKKERYY